MAPNPSFTDRVKKAAELIAADKKSIAEVEKTLTKDLKEAGIEDNSVGVSILDAESTEPGDLFGILQNGCGHGVPILKLKAAASVLKGKSLTKTTTPPDNKLPVVNADAQVQTIAEIMKSNRPIEQWNDRELLERFAKEREHEVEQELHKRAKQQNFIVLVPSEKKYEPGKEMIDVSTSLELLKNARKRTNPTMLPIEGKVLPVYKITELNPEDRIVALCPFCGETLYKGYCQKCESNVSGVGDDELAYVKLISELDTFDVNSFSDRKAVITSARKGLDDLKNTWPKLAQEFDELKATNNLPKLRVILNRPSDVADPFFQNGNRSFGHKTT